jgi:hypothetical protein
MIKMKHFFLPLLALLFHVESAAQRLITYNPIFEWVDEKETVTIHSFEGGGQQYSYEKLLNKKLDRLDSVVIWTNGTREFLPGFDLNENGQGKINTPEEADTLWFYARTKKAVYYHDYEMMQGSSRAFNVFFTEKPHLQIRHGFLNLPMRVDKESYVIVRDFVTCRSNDDWNKQVASWSAQYKGVVLFNTDRDVRLNFLGKKKEYTTEVLRAISANEKVAFVSVVLFDVLGNVDTYFNSHFLTVYTELNSERVLEIAGKYGFELIPDGRNGKRYVLRYTKSKKLDEAYIRNCKKLLSELSAKYGTNDFYHEVRLD